MKYMDIAAMPTTYHSDAICHESVMRAYHIVAKLRWLMERGTTNDVMLELLDLMETDIEPASQEQK